VRSFAILPPAPVNASADLVAAALDQGWLGDTDPAALVACDLDDGAFGDVWIEETPRPNGEQPTGMRVRRPGRHAQPTARLWWWAAEEFSR
jgi:hypothetical protein